MKVRITAGGTTAARTTTVVACACSYTWGSGLDGQPTEIRRPAAACPVHPEPVTVGACPGCGLHIDLLMLPGGPPC